MDSKKGFGGVFGKIPILCIARVRKGCRAKQALVASSSHSLEGLAVLWKVSGVRVKAAQGLSHCTEC